MSEVKKVVKSTTIYFIGSISSKLVAFFMLKVYTTYISPEDFGTYDVAVSYVTLITSILFLDIWSGIMRFTFDYEGKKDKFVAVYSGGIIYAGSTLLFTIVFFPLANYLKLVYPMLIYLYGLALCFQNLYGYIARSFGQNIVFMTSGILNTFINACMNVILIIIVGMNYKALYISYILGVFTQCYVIERKIHLLSNFKTSYINLNMLKSIFKFSLPLCTNSLFYWILTYYNKIIILKRLGSEYNGNYAIASKFTLALTLVSSAFLMAWQELAYGKSSVDKYTGEFYSKATNDYYKMLFCGSIMLIPIINIIFPFLIDKSYYTAKEITPIYIIATVFVIFSSFLGSILTTYKKTNIIFISTMSASITNITLLHLSIDKLGLISAPLSLLIGYLVNCLIRILIIKRTIDYSFDFKSNIYIIPLYILFILIYITNNIYFNIIAFLLASIITMYLFRTYILKVFKTSSIFRNKCGEKNYYAK